jgi:glycosyltransferase involved in cell wall biosynthesis
MPESDSHKRLKIAYIIPRFHPFKGGAEQNILAMASRMVAQGHDVTVITTNIKFRNEELPKTETFEGIKIIRQWSLNDQLYAGFYPELLPYLLSHEFDVIHASGIGFLWREMCLIIKKIFTWKTKFVVTPHGRFMALGDTEGARGVARKYYTAILKIFIPWLYDAVIQVNPKQSEWMQKEYGISPEKIKLIPNGIDQKYTEEVLIEHQPHEKVIITYINRQEWYKGIQDVIRALNIIKNKYKDSLGKDDSQIADFKFLVMGRAGNYTQKLKDLVEELEMQNYVDFIFSPSDEERDKIFYEDSQINILPSKWEAVGITLIEAMAKGNVVITTTGNEGADMIIKNEENGYIYKFGEFEELAEILEKLLLNPDLRRKMQEINLERAKNFTWEAIFPEYENLLLEVTK